MVRQAPPGLVLLSACYWGQRDGTLHSTAESLSQAAINFVGLWLSVLDRAAVVYDAGAASLLPGLVNGYGKIERRLGAIEGRSTRIEALLSISG